MDLCLQKDIDTLSADIANCEDPDQIAPQIFRSETLKVEAGAYAWRTQTARALTF